MSTALAAPFQAARQRIIGRIVANEELVPDMPVESHGGRVLRAHLISLKFALAEIDLALGIDLHTSDFESGSVTPPCMPGKQHNAQLNHPETGKCRCSWCGWVRDMTKGDKISEGKRLAAEQRRHDGVEPVLPTSGWQAQQRLANAARVIAEPSLLILAGDFGDGEDTLISLEEAVDLVDLEG